ncbi:MAG: rhodanese-like domain-containing protein [Bacteroidia bacterium]|nr:rhodanese-like domain-containing protein [Bacteroidia bacterium]
MKKSILILLPLAILLFSFIQQEPIKKEQSISTEELAKKINDPKAVKPVIFNVGPVDQIKTAIKVGAVNSDEGFSKFKIEAGKVSKDKEVVVYCGCCSSQNCPNIRPAIKYLTENGYKKAKVLDIPTGIKEDWVQKGYPVE